MDMANTTIRDFIYLDIERVRSFSAQLFGGLPSERVTSGQHQTGGNGEVKGKVPFLAEATGTMDYHYVKSNSETRSIHDHLFAEFLDKMNSERRIQDIAHVSDHSWKKEVFKDGSFFRAQCPLKILDYTANVRLIQAFPMMLQQATLLSGNTPLQNVDQQPETTMIPQPQADALRDIMGHLYGDTIRIKVFPVPSRFDKVLIGSAYRDSFRISPITLSNLYGSIIDAGWMCILQVNKGEQHPAAKMQSKTGNQLEDTIERSIDQFAELSNLTQGVIFPAVAITPIAIFREIR